MAWNHILVTGNAGAGKSTVAARLGAILNREVTGLDRIVWGPGWTRPPVEERTAAIDAIAEQPLWLVEGVSKTLCRAADVIVFLDYPRRTCYRRVLKRNLPYLFKSRPGMPDDCPEYRIMGTLVKIIWRFPEDVRPLVLEEMAQLPGDRLVFHVRSERELGEMLRVAEQR